MTTTTKTTMKTRTCLGSKRFGIESHEAATSQFPKQPSRKDGLGRMCSEHWKAYVSGLREARVAAAGTEPKAAKPRAAAKPPAFTPAQIAHDAKLRKASTQPRRLPKAAKPSANAAKIAKAEKLIAEVDALPADHHVERVGDDDVQAALETTAGARMLAD